jgi:hypothetical protein
MEVPLDMRITRSVSVALAVVLTAAAALPALASDSGRAWYADAAALLTPGAVRPKTPAHGPVHVGRARLMRMKGIQLMNGLSKAPVGTASTPHLQYFGGPLLSKVKVQIVYWNSQVSHQDKLPGFYSSVLKSPYFDWLKEYDGGGQTVGEGKYLGAYTDSVKAAAGSQIEDADIRTELSKRIADKSLPAPDANTLYMVYFPPGLNIDLGGSGSCQVFCAYHNTYTADGRTVAYGVIPDQGGSCAGGCGGAANEFDNETSVSSHELIEAVTDPQVGLVTGNQPEAPMGWYDSNYGEIGDICNAVQAKVGAYTVQREWSNSRNLCVASQDDPGSPVSPWGVTSANGSSPKVVASAKH